MRYFFLLGLLFFPLLSFSKEELPEWLSDEKLKEIMDSMQENGGYTEVQLLDCPNIMAIKYVRLEMWAPYQMHRLSGVYNFKGERVCELTYSDLPPSSGMECAKGVSAESIEKCHKTTNKN